MKNIKILCLFLILIMGLSFVSGSIRFNDGRYAISAGGSIAANSFFSWSEFDPTKELVDDYPLGLSLQTGNGDTDLACSHGVVQTMNMDDRRGVQICYQNGGIWTRTRNLDEDNFEWEDWRRFTTDSDSSDIRLKKNIRPLENPLSKIMQFNGVNYNWRIDEYSRMDFNDKTQIGLIAQDVEEIVPELVSTDSQGYKSISYQKISVLLVESIKDQQNQIDELKEEIERLKELIE
ncbi:MAG: tail fiber domain-containing protein [Nanoarchaeota archaeon]